jgi:hypothetical protein
MRHVLAPKTCTLASLLGRPRQRDTGFKTVLVYCVGPAEPRSYHDCCHHNGRLRLEDLPDWDWRDISAHQAARSLRDLSDYLVTSGYGTYFAHLGLT